MVWDLQKMGEMVSTPCSILSEWLVFLEMDSFQEQQPWGTTFYTVKPESHVTLLTEKAKIDLITNPYFGRMLFIDGVLQSTTGDEHMYHQPLIYYAMRNRKQEKVLIVGGAEGATVREVQNRDAECELGVKEIIMVDWDKQLVELMDKEEPWSQGSFDDERLSLYFQDINQYLDEHADECFDTVILDLLDPENEEELEWLIQLVHRCLERTNYITLNAGSNSTYIKKMVSAFSKYPTVASNIIHVPSFQAPWYLISIEKV